MHALSMLFVQDFGKTLSRTHWRKTQSHQQEERRKEQGQQEQQEQEAEEG